jgi:ubiquinone/menaquinone biosynthesis C-methylase UbiE
MTTQSSTHLATEPSPSSAVKAYKGMAMEGIIAKWYTKVRGRDADLARAVRQVSENVPPGGEVLEVAPGPGFLAVELAKLGKFHVTGLDISKSFVQIAQAKAAEAGVTVDFQLGNASAMPFTAAGFDFIICRAAFKNFTQPVEAIREMHRVLKPGGKALIADLRRDATPEQIEAEVGSMGLSRTNAFLTRLIFRTFLLKNAYSPDQIRQMAAQTEFAACTIDEIGIGMEIWLQK